MSTSAFTDQAKQDFLNGVHQPTDVYKIALYTASATNDKTLTAYTATNEISGAGYAAGGIALTGFTVGISGDTAYITWTTNPSWPTATFTAASAVIYNSTRSNKALAVIDFGGSFSVTGGTFTVQLPAAGLSAILRIA
ncbi:MAG TPA: hypothetical protein VN607_02160 [Gemmatimonadaceae bacterium]|nr:hypothetical protein [Gemmatimonadaceae bacterium]